MEVKAINLWLADNLEEKKSDNKFENFLWKRAKIHKLETLVKENSSNLLNIKKNLWVNETVQSISEEIEEYMVDYLKTMEFAKNHSEEISDFFSKNLKIV